MPECQPNFVLSEGDKYSIHFLFLTDPKRDYELCKRWIHNLGNEKLNIKTFVFSYHKIVCEEHFEEDCFKELRS